MRLTIQKAAALSGITQRALRHYDSIGLLKPAARSEAGYRLYTDEDMTRLQQILLFRELRFPLKDIARLMSHPEFDATAALRRQAEHLKALSQRYERLSALALETLRHKEENTVMSNEEKFESFDYKAMLDGQKAYEPEVKARWGDTDAYKTSVARTKHYTKQDWQTIHTEAEQTLLTLITCFREALPAADPRVQTVCEQAREHIDKYYYPCSKEMFAQLGEMYVADERFTAYYDSHEKGLAVYYREAIRIYCKSGNRDEMLFTFP